MILSSNNTNKLSPQELRREKDVKEIVQIIQINLVLKNRIRRKYNCTGVQIIQINLVLKNPMTRNIYAYHVQIIQINLVLKNPSQQNTYAYQFK